MNQSMNQTFLNYLSGDTDLYPSELAQQFPHIFSKLIEFIDSNEFSEYLNDVIFDSRGGRQGFPPEVVSELWKLQWHRMRVENAKATDPKQDYWNWINKNGLANA
jgi:hypothetical protein